MGISVTRSTKSPWKRSTGEISAGQTVIVDAEPSTTIAMEYVVAAKSVNKTISLHYSLLKEGSALKSRVFGKQGTLNVSIDEDEVSGEIRLRITNNEATTISYDLVALKLLK